MHNDFPQSKLEQAEWLECHTIQGFGYTRLNTLIPLPCIHTGTGMVGQLNGTIEL